MLSFVQVISWPVMHGIRMIGNSPAIGVSTFGVFSDPNIAFNRLKLTDFGHAIHLSAEMCRCRLMVQKMVAEARRYLSKRQT
jgi:hypothetical protein